MSRLVTGRSSNTLSHKVLTDALAPVSGLPVQMHDGDDPDVIIQCQVHDAVGEPVSKVSAGRRIELPK